jgi:GNAT superfamily N-acetyltransferase
MSSLAIAVTLAETDDEILACFGVMAELRPHLKQESFVAQVRQQMDAGYMLAYVIEGQQVFVCAGFRVFQTLAWGRILYVDDLVTATRAQRRGYGAAMMQWLVDYARREKCEELHLDSGTWRTGAHRFYFKHDMVIKSFHFSREL